MNKIIFKVGTPKENSIISLLKEVHHISCRIHLDIENGIITVENINDTMLDYVINLIDNYYTVLSIDFNNTSLSETVEQSAHIAVPKPKNGLEPQSGDDLIINKIHFENKCVEEAINKFLKTAYWAMFKMNVNENRIQDFIYTSIKEISIKYTKKECIEFNVGDVVDCYYGTHLYGEINGNHIPSVVCNISNNSMVYVVPITSSDISSPTSLSFNIPEDIIYKDETEKRCTMLLDKAKYVNAKRFDSVIGKTSHAFLEKLLKLLPLAFDFAGSFQNNPIHVQNVKDSVSTMSSTASNVEKKLGKEETAMLEVIGFALEKLDSSKPMKAQLDPFLTDIGMPTTNVIQQAFILSCNVDKITYGYLTNELDNIFSYSKRKNNSKKILRETFKSWSEKYPALLEKCPKISIMPMLKLFAKKFE